MIKTINGPSFSPLFALRAKQLAWFLGAGASASAGIPTGYAMIRDFKKRLFCQLSAIPLKDVDSDDPLWIERMNLLFSNRGVLPPDNDPTEYAAAFEAVYPTQEVRRMYIEEAVRKGTPSFAHRVLGALITSQKIPCVFTTNFDSLLETATTVTDQLMEATNRVYLTTAAIDNPDRARRALNESKPFLAKLHGDFQSIELKNTTDELKEQDTKMRQILIDACSRFGLVVVGYSGRDNSIMETLTESLSKPNAFPGGIFWVTRSKSSLLPAVTQFLNQADQLGISSTIVECHTFDEITADIVDGLELPSQLSTHIYENRPEPILRQVPLPNMEKRSFPILLCSAIPILVMPTVARLVEVNKSLNTVEIRNLIKSAKVNVIAANCGKNIAAFGSDKDILQIFSPFNGQISGTIQLNPADESWALGMLYDALTKALCRNRPLFPQLRMRGHSILVSNGFPDENQAQKTSRIEQLSNLKKAYTTDLTGKIPKFGYPFNEGVQIKLTNDAGRWWCLFEPFTHVKLPRLDEKDSFTNHDSSQSLSKSHRPESQIVDWNRERWANRYNYIWSRIISVWAVMLSGKADSNISSIGLQEGTGVDAVFQLSPIAGWSRPSHEHDYFIRKG